jgi:hypothetical protein
MKNKEKTILCLMITLIFLMPLMGNTATATSSTVTYVFCDYDPWECWPTDPRYMTDGEIDYYASTCYDGDVQCCTGNNCTGQDLGDITRVEIRAYGYTSSLGANIILRAVFGGVTDGDNHTYYLNIYPYKDWSPWFDITGEKPSINWSWNDVFSLDCDVESDLPYNPPHIYCVYCSMVQIRVTYSP